MLKNFRFLTSGESHGKYLNGIIDGVPSGVEISTEEINKDLQRRQSGYGRGERMQIEADTVCIKAGIRLGETTGAPICLEIENKDYENWQEIMNTEKTSDIQEVLPITSPRPGHADFAGSIKYNRKDIRDIIERSSARKTAMDVAIGSIAKQILKIFDITGQSIIINIYGETESERIKQVIDNVKAEGDTIGGKFEIRFKNLPVGLGSHIQWDKKLDGAIAQAIMSIPAIKSVEIGLGEKCAYTKGSMTHDEIFLENEKIIRKTNNAGGIEGGISNGNDIIVKAVMKAIPTLQKELYTIDLKEMKQTKAHSERSDTCAVEACAVVAEAMTACVILDAFLDKFGSDNIEEIKRNYFGK